jgi:hypothetical protein
MPAAALPASRCAFTLTANLALISMCSRLPMLWPTPYTGRSPTSAC